jgi:hypothetical protein
VTSEIATCIRCGIRRHIHARRENPYCQACAYTRIPPPDPTCELPPGRWVRDGLVLRWQATPPPETPRPRRRRGPMPERRLPPDQLAPCGTHSAYCRHKRRGETIDAACLEAERQYKAEWMRQNRAQQRQKEAA